MHNLKKEKTYAFLLVLTVLLSLLCSKTSSLSDSKHGNSTSFDESSMENIARNITVKVYSEDTWASGIILCRREESYVVATSKHFLSASEWVRVKTPDSETYVSSVVNLPEVSRIDVGLLMFTGVSQNYHTAQFDRNLGNTLNKKANVSGFPLDIESGLNDRLSITEGEVMMILEQPLFNGYQIGYTNEISQGMSGGPLLDWQGHVIGLNGLRRFPLWGNPYVYQDGTDVPDPEQLRQLAWAIPINVVLSQAAAIC